MTGAADTVPAGDNRRVTLVGREREVVALRAQLAGALRGQGALVLIGGEAGIGKTVLAEATLDDAPAQGALALVGRCYDLTETPPYGPWAEAFARLPADVGRASLPAPLGDGEAASSQAAIFARVRDYLAVLAGRQPLVLLLDDLHWADPASLDLLRFLGRQVAALPLLLLVTYRSDELTRRHPLYALLPLLERESRAARLDRQPLSEAALRALVARHTLADRDAERLVAWLLARAEGNAFFTTQLLRAAVADRLFVSRGTVSTHLRAVYGKLGVTSRTAAARLATDHGLR